MRFIGSYKDQTLLQADSEDSNQTGWKSRLIGVFTGRTSNFVGFVMLRLSLTEVLKSVEVISAAARRLL